MTDASTRRHTGRLGRSRLVLFAIASAALGGSASAAPRVTLKVTPIPIPGFPHTGDILGAGAEVEAVVTITGSEYGGFPSPLTQLSFFAPTGVKVDSDGFATCELASLEANGFGGCPKKSSAGPLGEGLGVAMSTISFPS